VTATAGKTLAFHLVRDRLSIAASQDEAATAVCALAPPEAIDQWVSLKVPALHEQKDGCLKAVQPGERKSES